MKNELVVRAPREGEAPPMDLLLLADPSEELVRGYLARGVLRLGEANGKVVAETLVVDEGGGVAELINVAVDEAVQGLGYGKRMVLAAIGEARQAGYRRIEVGTGNPGFGQLALYQKCGFRMDSIRKNFFVDNYPEPIWENGLQCMDMVRLAIDFD